MRHGADMSELNTIEAALQRAARRRHLDRILRGAWRGLFVASVVLLLALIVYKFLPVPIYSLVIAGGVGLACIVVGAIAAGWRKPTVHQTARWVDVKQNLKERLSTALEMSQNGSGEEWRTLLVNDAAQHAQGLDAKKLLPLHLPRVTRWALLILLLAAGLGFVPEYRSKQFLQKQADAANIKDAGKQLAELTKRSLEAKPPALEPTEKAIEKVEEVGQQLQKLSLTKADALKQISSARDKIAEEMKELQREGALKPLERASREPGGKGGGQTPEALQKQIDALQKSMGSGEAQDPGKMDQFEKDLAKAQQMAANLPDKDSPEGKAAREQLSQMLSNLAQQMKDAGMPLDSLEDALKALKQGNIDQFVKDMNVAGEDLHKLSDMAKQLQSLQQQQAGAEAGKDLAEQLKKAQTDAAQQTLQKMMEQLKSGQLSQEQLNKILDEVAKAVSPASEYGKVAEHLKNAVKQMQQCQNPGSSSGQKQQAKAGAAQSLSDAANELAKLAQQMADAQQLAQMMEALDRAQQAIASGKGWGQCKGGGTCPYCGGKGCLLCRKKSGGGMNASGVGTWADETGWTYYTQQDQTPVDNSGIVRPDTDPRGISERDASLNPDLKPTKVKGQLNPGGPMPSVTLKGVSIKGQSKVEFEESAAAAQTEAQSALNQDQVPRAYRGAVRDYFDDLKK
jgi:uncharacterized protein with von Willebrand factor type A (vWA) domain